jgi:raffinose/stachyose/melibiose transport system substrate-binding protein
MFFYLDNPALYSVSWNFPTFPSQEFKNDLGAALYDYAIGGAGWDTVSRTFIDAWAAEKAAIR